MVAEGGEFVALAKIILEFTYALIVTKLKILFD